MSSDSWRQISDLYNAALNRQGTDRSVFLAEACAANGALQSQVESLLAATESSDSPPPPQRAHPGPSPPIVSVAGGRLDCYVIEALLGAGGMGVVYKARDTRLDRTVAIKILPSADPDRRARFEREAKAIAAIQHPHICTLYDLGHDSGIDYLVLEYVDGETLAARLRRGPLPLEDALDVAVEITDALDKVHSAGVVHRDLKPGNVMLTKAGVKVLDFGLAKLRSTPAQSNATAVADSVAMTARGVIVGTLPYMAPEQLEGRAMDHRVDIWALGCIMHEAIGGRRVFAENSDAGVIASILYRDPAPLSAVQPQATPALERIVAKCLSKDPDRRWQTSRDLLDEIRWVRQTLAVPAPVPARDAAESKQPLEAAAPPGRRRPRFFFRLSIGITFSALLAVLLLRDARRPIDPPSSGVPETAVTPDALSLPPAPSVPAPAPPPSAQVTTVVGPPPPAASPFEPARTVPPEQGGLQPLQGESQREYAARLEAMRKRYDEAVALLSSGAYHKSDQAFTAIVSEASDRYLEAGKLLRESKDNLRQIALKMYAEARGLESRGEFDKAITTFLQAAATSPDIVVVGDIQRVVASKTALGEKMCLEGRANYAVRQAAVALQAYEEALRLLPSDNKCYAEAKERVALLRK
jgi:serine/threonine protein kinase